MSYFRQKKTLRLVQLALLTALELIFAFTPLGYLRIGMVEITFMTIPIAIGAVMLGMGASAFLGFLFGITSFIQCFMGSPLGSQLIAIDPFLTFVLCVGTRTLMGFLCGLCYRLLSRKKEESIPAILASSFSAPALNTLFFVLFFFLAFRTAVLNFGNGNIVDMNTMNMISAFVVMAGVNALVEIPVCTVISASLGKALLHIKKK